MAAACELVIADDPEAWRRVGFRAGDDGVVRLGALALRLAGRGAGEGIAALVLEGDVAEAPDGLPVRGGGAAPPEGATAHPNTATAVDHVVVLTGDRDRTAAALAAAGGDLRRRGEPPELPARMAFVRFGPLVVEVAQAGGPPRFWGVTIAVRDVDAATALAGAAPRAAVQPGRRILTVPLSAGLATAVALISPR